MTDASAPLIFLDLETTGLDPDLDEIWEMAAVAGVVKHRTLHLSQLFHRFVKVNPGAIQRLETIPPPEHFQNFERRYDPSTAVSAYLAVAELLRFTEQACAGDVKPHLVGACPGFDDRFITDQLFHGVLGRPWHYHLIDVENLGAGKLGLQPPLKSDDISRHLGVNPDDFDRHSAVGDVEWAYHQYAAVYELDLA